MKNQEQWVVNQRVETLTQKVENLERAVGKLTEMVVASGQNPNVEMGRLHHARAVRQPVEM